MKGAYVAPDWSLAERLEHHSMPEPNSGCHLWIAGVNKTTSTTWWPKVAPDEISTAYSRNTDEPDLWRHPDHEPSF